MTTTYGFFNFTAFCYLIASMGLQVIWSFALALVDAYALIRKKVLHNPVLVSLFVVGDWVTGTLALAGTSASAGVTVLYFSEKGRCYFGDECQKYQISVVLAYLSWIANFDIIFDYVLAAGYRLDLCCIATGIIFVLSVKKERGNYHFNTLESG